MNFDVCLFWIENNIQTNSKHGAVRNNAGVRGIATAAPHQVVKVLFWKRQGVSMELLFNSSVIS